MNKLKNVVVDRRNHDNTAIVHFRFDDDRAYGLTFACGEDRMSVANKLRALADQINVAPAYGGPPS